MDPRLDHIEKERAGKSCVILNPRRKFFHTDEHREVCPPGLPTVRRIGLAELLREFGRV
jgi:hypothetical protein